MRYNNPHMNQVPMHNNQGRGPMTDPRFNQQPMNQGYPQQYPPQQGYPQQYPQQPMNQGYPQQFPPQQGYPNQGYPQQYPPQQMPGQFPQQFPNQGYPQQFQPQQPSINNNTRFTSQQSPNQEFNTNPQESSRYTTMNTNTPQAPVVLATEDKPTVFTVKPTQVKLPYNSNLKFNTITSSLDQSNIRYINDLSLSDCQDEVVEGVIEKAYDEETTKTLTVCKGMFYKSFYKVDLAETVIKLFSGNVKSLYKGLKTLYNGPDNKYELVVYDAIDSLLTDYVNDFLFINAVKALDIDSFVGDFNDLLKVIRNHEEDLENQLMDYLDTLLIEYKETLEAIDKESAITRVYKLETVAYLDKHVLETGLNPVTDVFHMLENSPPNVFLNSLIEQTFTVSNSTEFCLVTLDRTKFKVMLGQNKKYYIKSLSY